VNCQRALEMIHFFVDEELDFLETAEVQRHIDECDDCNLLYCYQIVLRSTLQDASFYYRAPLELKIRLRSSLQKEARAKLTLYIAS
jgi:putative zinc finger protein